MVNIIIPGPIGDLGNSIRSISQKLTDMPKPDLIQRLRIRLSRLLAKQPGEHMPRGWRSLRRLESSTGPEDASVRRDSASWLLFKKKVRRNTVCK